MLEFYVLMYSNINVKLVECFSYFLIITCYFTIDQEPYGLLSIAQRLF